MIEAGGSRFGGMIVRGVCLALAASLVSGAEAQETAVSGRVGDVLRGFASPPDDARVLMRWWWFGPGVVKPELQREMLAMKAGGFGGFEIQPVYPMALDDPQTGFKNLGYLSPEFLDDVKFVNEKARENGLRVDLTLASGWPYGGPKVPVSEAAGRLRMVVADLPAETGSFPLPSLANGEHLVAAFVGVGAAKQFDAGDLRQIEMRSSAGRGSLAAAPEGRVVVCFVASRTGQQVKRAAVNAEGFVLDHLSRAAVEHHLQDTAEPLIKVFGDAPPYSVFSDSLEVYQTDWTDDLPAEFQRRRGYDLVPHLPELFTGQGVAAAAIRHDWGLTQTELVNERYLTPINEWATAHHTRFRSQTYGEPAVSMSSNRLVSLPEGEGPQWRSFSFTRWATSASHLYGRPVTSAETWTWLHSPAFRATPLDMKAEADRMFLEGVNQFVGHGWPYTPPGAPEPGWSFYAAAVFNDHNPWWLVMPDVTKYLQRISYLLRQGRPANDVAVLLPTDDAYAAFTPGHASVSGEMGKYVTPAVTQQILDAGHNLDYIDAEAIDRLGIPYPVLILPHVTRLSPGVLRKIAAYRKGGGKVIAVGSKPSLAPGFVEAARLSMEVDSLSSSLFGAGGASFVATDQELGAALKAALAPDLMVESERANVGFVHRKLDDADVYFIVNTSNHAVHTTATVNRPRGSAEWWDPFSGQRSAASVKPVLDLAPYESRVLVLMDVRQGAAPGKTSSEAEQLLDLSRDWQVSFGGGSARERMVALRSWTDDEQTRFFSGQATYTKDIELTAAELKGRRILLDFGEGTPVEANARAASGMRALLESPVREAAAVTINGSGAGSVWHPPYALDVTALLHAGKNHLEVRVGNLGINTLAGRAEPDYRLLSSRYGQRFVPQDMNNLKPLPSGMLGPVRLMGEANP